MTPRYTFRIMAALPGHTPVELFRASRHYAQADWNYWTRDLAPEWQAWVEYTLADKHCVSERPKIRDPRYIASTRGLHLTHAEKQVAEIEPEFNT
jgi:hypothetical protein